MGREWFGLLTDRILHPAFRALPASIRCHWLTLFAFCASEETGCIRGATRRSQPAWELLGVPPGAVRQLEEAGLVVLEDAGLRIVGYDVELGKAHRDGDLDNRLQADQAHRNLQDEVNEVVIARHLPPANETQKKKKAGKLGLFIEREKGLEPSTSTLASEGGGGRNVEKRELKSTTKHQATPRSTTK
jgi:hypothetical protein